MWSKFEQIDWPFKLCLKYKTKNPNPKFTAHNQTRFRHSRSNREQKIREIPGECKLTTRQTENVCHRDEISTKQNTNSTGGIALPKGRNIQGRNIQGWKSQGRKFSLQGRISEIIILKRRVQNTTTITYNYYKTNNKKLHKDNKYI